MSAFEIMKDANLLDWHTLLVGIERGWCKKRDVIDCAEECLRQKNDQINEDLIDIIFDESLSNAKIIAVMIHLTIKLQKPLSLEMKEKALEKWRFAHISSLLKSEQSPNDKINGLQELYGEFGFPEDMASCSVYSRDRVDPLDAAGIVMQKLWQKFKNSGVKNAEVRSCLLPYIQAQGSN